jgi:very-short-patch-repair endonuclease
MKHVCQICQKEIYSFCHLKKAHKIIFKEYYDKFIKKNNEGFCIICGKEAKWHNKIHYGFYYDKTCGDRKCKKELSLKNLKNTKQYWISKGFNENEALSKISQIQKIRNEKAVKKLYSLKKERKYFDSTSIEYWMNKGYSEEDAKEKRSERQKTFSKEKCIKKYGEKEGLKRWQERQNKWQNTLKNKPINEKIAIEKKRLKRNGYTVSKAEKKIINIIKKKYDIDLENQKVMLIFGKNKKYIYDFCLEDHKKIIEYNGDFWHCNPEIYSPNYFNPVIHMQAKDKWRKDKKKIKFAEQNGYDVLVIWEKDFKYNENNTIEKIISFLNEGVRNENCS